MSTKDIARATGRPVVAVREAVKRGVQIGALAPRKAPWRFGRIEEQVIRNLLEQEAAG